MINDIKTFIVITISSLAAYLSPINNIIVAVVVAFILNFLAGYIAGMLMQGERFNLKKAFNCIKESTIFFVMIASIFSIGYS